jgi:hypothetical protein
MLRSGLFFVAALVVICGTAFADVGEAKPAVPPPTGEIHGNIGITYDTQYVWRGILVYGADSAIHPFVDLDLCGSGFHLEAIGHMANDSGHVNGQRWDYALYHAGVLNAEQTWEIRHIIGYRYFNYPSMPSQGSGSIDLQETFAGVAFPNLLGIPRLVPGYAVVKGWPSSSDTVVGAGNPNGGTYSGWAHILMLDYAVPMTCICPELSEQMLNLHAETVYNGAVDPRPLGGYTDHDWTHVLFVASTDLDLGGGAILTPAVNYQITFEDNGNKGPVVSAPGVYQGINPNHDMVWASLTLKYKF